MNENDDKEKNIKFYHMHVHPRNDSWAELVLANIDVIFHRQNF
jgi:hypothetical protein